LRETRTSCRSDSASEEEEPPAKKARVQGSSTRSGEPLGEKARPDREAAAPKADAAKFARNTDVVQDPEVAATKLEGLTHKLKITRQKLARRDRRLVVVTDRSKRARETLQELGPIVAGQRALARAGEGSALKNFCTGFLNGKFSIDTIYFQDFANGTDNINKSSTRGFRHRQSVPPHPRAGHPAAHPGVPASQD
jgi:hypothetical protein